MSNMDFVAHAYGQASGAPPVINFSTQYLCQAIQSSAGRFDVSFGPGIVASQGDLKVDVAIVGDPHFWTVTWNAADPITGLQAIRIETYDATGAIHTPDEIYITVHRVVKV